MVELFLAVHFVLNVFVFRLVRLALVKVFYTTYFLTGELRVLMIRIGFAIRHLFLMTGFKGYGVFVDTFYSLKVIFNFIYYRIFYFMFSHMFNFMYYRVFYFMYYRVLCSFFPRVSNFIYYRLLYFFYYRILYFSYYRLSSYMANIFKYHLKHLFLISVYKIYGGLYDLATFSYRLTKLTLMYPFFKTYWFLSFQYKKRIKKNLV